MNRLAIAEHLLRAERHVLTANALTARQREIVAALEREGNKIQLAQQLLDTFVGLEDAHVADRDRLRRELVKEG